MSQEVGIRRREELCNGLNNYVDATEISSTDDWHFSVPILPFSASCFINLQPVLACAKYASALVAIKGCHVIALQKFI
jgi:hypothetical protein